MNNLFTIQSKIYLFKTPEDFFYEINLKKNDLLLTSRRFEQDYLLDKKNLATICFFEDYCKGEPTDQAIDNIKSDIELHEINRIIGIGGGSILDTCKFLAIDNQENTSEIFNSTKRLTRKKELILVPTTCGTGSEVTNIAVCELISEKTKKGLSDSVLYADKAMLVPIFLETLPQKIYATSAIDALIHAIESYLSPNATLISQDFSKLAIEKLLFSFQSSVLKSCKLIDVTSLALLGSVYAGIAFTNAGVGTIHAMSYPFGSKFHVPHGESNYVFLFSVLEHYKKQGISDELKKLEKIIGNQLDISSDQAFIGLKSLLHKILPLKNMSDYGGTHRDSFNFSEIVYHGQQRLLNNSPVPISLKTLISLYDTSLD